MNRFNLYWSDTALLTKQKTIQQPIWCCGRGLHSGKDARVQLAPADENTGIVFQVMDGNHILGNIPAHVGSVKSGMLRTVLQADDVSVETTEHLLAAAMACGISNLRVQVWGNEIPIHAGSADTWAFLLDCAGNQEQDSHVRSIKILREIEVNDGYALCKLTPSAAFELHYDLGYDHPLVGQQHYSFQFSRDNFDKQIAKARTFGFIKDLDYLIINGLSHGANLTNTLVFGKDDLMNPEGMTWKDEPVRHKIVDAIGDLALAGAPIIGKFYGYRSGHNLNHKLVAALLKNVDSWTWDI